MLDDNIVATITKLQTQDEKEVNITLHIYYKITNVLKVAKEVGNPVQVLRTVVLRDIYNFIGDHSYEELMLNRTDLCDLAKYPFLVKAATKSGIEIIKIVGVFDSFVKAKKDAQYNVL